MDAKQRNLEQQRKDNEGLSDEEIKRLEDKLKAEEDLIKGEYIDPDEDVKKPEGKDEGKIKEEEVEYKTEPVKPESPPSDSTSTVSKPKAPSYGLTYGIVNNLSRLKNITASYQNGYVMNYSRKTEALPFAFQVGLPHSVPAGFLDATTDDNTITLGSGISFSRNIDSVINYSYTTNKRYASASNQSIGYTFPDVTLTLMNFESWIGMNKYLSGTRLNTGFQNTVRQNGDINWVKPKQETNTIAFNPLLGFSGSILRVVNTNLSFSMSKAENITDMDSYQILKTNSNQSLNGNISYSFRSGRGFTIPFTKRKIHIKNELSSSLAISYDKSFDETHGREASQVDRNTTRLAITPGATYQFDQNIRGGLTSSYEITTDKKRDDGTKKFSLGIWVEVNL